MEIRSERPSDAPSIGQITTAAFADAPHSSGTEASIVQALRDAGALTISLVATSADGEVIGHIAFSPVEIGQMPGRWYGLGPVSVLPQQQGQGIGGALIREGLQRLRELGAQGCVLLGEPAYYNRFGFEADPALTYLGYRTRHLQRVVFDGEPPGGEVRYHRAFEAS